MTVTKTMVETIFNTLPIGYYLGRRIDTTLSNSDESYFNPVDDKIVIGSNMITSAICRMPENESIDLESVVRGLLYHEISHVILTPDNLYEGKQEYHDVLNLVEDERIETILKDFYMNVNFKRNIVIINNYQGEPPRNTWDAFYHLVRYHVGDPRYLKELASIINKYKNINASYNSDYSKRIVVRQYTDAIIDLYKRFCKNCQDNSNNNNSNGNGNGSGNNSSNGDATNDTMNDIDNEDGTGTGAGNNAGTDSTDSLDKKTTNKIKELNINISNSEIKNIINEAIKSVIDIYRDEELINKMTAIIDRKLKQRQKNGSAIISYNGKMVPKQVGTREDYMWWCQQNRMGHIRRFSKVHFILVLDNSSSFSHNDHKMNVFLRALEAINNPDFSFDVITVNHTIVEWDTTHRQFKSSGGTHLKSEIGYIVKKHMKSQANNYKIVLFDGDASPDATKNGNAFSFFDDFSSIVVTNVDNKRYIDKYGKMKKVIINNNYCNTFIDEVLNLLDKVI